MEELRTQQQRLDFLVEAFKKDSVRYRDLRTPVSTEEKRELLRSLMNIRMPKALPEEVLLVQDQYLKQRAEEKGIVRPDDIPVIRDGMCIWQGVSPDWRRTPSSTRPTPRCWAASFRCTAASTTPFTHSQACS